MGKILTILALCAIMSGCEVRFRYESHPILAIGTKVQQKTGGPEMIVIGTNDKGLVKCRWYDPAGTAWNSINGYRCQEFYEAELEQR